MCVLYICTVFGVKQEPNRVPSRGVACMMVLTKKSGNEEREAWQFKQQKACEAEMVLGQGQNCGVLNAKFGM